MFYNSKKVSALKNKGDISRLIKLYLSYHLNKVVLILLCIVLGIWGIVLLMNSGYPLEMDSYIVQPKVYHSIYLEQSIFFLQIIDGVIVAFLVGSELSSLALFDPMFVPNVSRIKIICAKLLANLIILFTMLSLQILIMYFLGIVLFPSFTVDFSYLKVILYIGLSLIELLLAGEFISILLNTYFIPILIFILHILTMILLKNETISKYLLYFIPRIDVKGTSIYLVGNLILYAGICLVFLLGIVLVFQKKDISNT